MSALEHLPRHPSSDSALRRRTYVLAITNRCNLTCPLCYAQGSSSGCLVICPRTTSARSHDSSRRMEADVCRCPEGAHTASRNPENRPDVAARAGFAATDRDQRTANRTGTCVRPRFEASCAWQVNLQLDTLCDETYGSICAADVAQARKPWPFRTWLLRDFD